jgi:DNA-binding transcriptional LysR family regulator
MVAVAERIEDEVMAVARDLAGRDHSLSGRLRLTSSETLAYRLLTRHIAAFRAAHPGVVVELSIENRVLDLSRREADVALRPMRPRQKDLWGRKLADVAWCLYRGVGSGEHGMQAVIGWDPEAADIGAADWLAASVPAAAIVFRTSSLINQMTAARAGMGVALLPCYLGDAEPGLVRAVPEPLGDMRSELWIVTHVDLRRTARVRAFFDGVIEGMAGDRGLIEGALAAVYETDRTTAYDQWRTFAPDFSND